MDLESLRRDFPLAVLPARGGGSRWTWQRIIHKASQVKLVLFYRHFVGYVHCKVAIQIISKLHELYFF